MSYAIDRSSFETIWEAARTAMQDGTAAAAGYYSVNSTMRWILNSVYSVPFSSLNTMLQKYSTGAYTAGSRVVDYSGNYVVDYSGNYITPITA